MDKVHNIHHTKGDLYAEIFEQLESPEVRKVRDSTYNFWQINCSFNDKINAKKYSV